VDLLDSAKIAAGRGRNFTELSCHLRTFYIFLLSKKRPRSTREMRAKHVLRVKCTRRSRAESPKGGESFRVQGIGAVSRRLSPKGNKIRASIVFQASENLRKRLGFPDDEPIRKVRGLCRTCGLRPGKVRIYDECGTCMRQKPSAENKVRGRVGSYVD